MDRRRIEGSIRRLLRARSSGASICPSEVARDLAEGEAEWRSLMPRVREVAAAMADRGEIAITQKGAAVDARTARGPIRIGAAAARASRASRAARAAPAAPASPADKTAYADAYRGVDFRAEPGRYRVGRGEEGVLIAEPYKSELLPLWRFRTPDVAAASAKALWAAFVAYRRARDFVGMDMARKYLQMGFTRARRYANRRSGRKYDEEHRTTPLDPDPVKAASAAVFYEVWQKAERDRTYRAWRKRQAH